MKAAPIPAASDAATSPNAADAAATTSSAPTPEPDTAYQPTEEEIQRWLQYTADMAILGPPGAAAGLEPPWARSASAARSSSAARSTSAATNGHTSARRGAAASEDTSSSSPPLQVSIGRLDVVAPPPEPVRRRPPRLRPHTSLTSYLDRRRPVIP